LLFPEFSQKKSGIMKYKFYNPYIIWFGIWVFICIVVSLITLQNNKLYWQSNMALERSLSYHTPFGEFSRQFGFSQDPLDRYQFSPSYRRLLRSQWDKPPLSLFLEPGTQNRVGRDFSLWPQGLSSSETPGNQRQWLLSWQSLARASYFVPLLSYLLFVVGFGAICLITAIYQNHFRRAQEEGYEAKIEARNLRIQVLESSRNTLDLKLRLLDQDHGKALSAAHEAQEIIRDLEGKLQSEAHRNVELQAGLQKARLEENQALNLLRSLDRDRQEIAAEQMDIAFRLAEAEKPLYGDLYLQKVRKARGRLRLNSFWLASLYKNLSFSPRALQNIGEIQDAPDVFPSLPDALANLNNANLEALRSGESLPPKSVARFTTQELEHFQGPFWEYRFSSDGRIFFGLSKSRTWNIDTILLKRRLPDKKEKYDRHLAAILGKDNQDLKPELIS
jgi:hypothetical protein